MSISLHMSIGLAFSWGRRLCKISGKKKQHKHKLFGPDFLRTFLTLTPGCPGVKKFLPATGAAENRTFLVWTSRVLEKLCPEKVCVDLSAPKIANRGVEPCSVFEITCPLPTRH